MRKSRSCSTPVSSGWLPAITVLFSVSLGLQGAAVGSAGAVTGRHVAPYLSGQGSLEAVSARTSNDVWAVGSTGPSTLILHWDGTSWSRVKSPNGSAEGNVLTGVSAISGTDVWAVGSYGCGSSCTHTLTLHWDGTIWSKVKFTPHTGSHLNELNAVSAHSASDVWAVGCSQCGFLDGRTLILHWNGTSWSKLKSPSPGARSALFGASAVSPTDAWAVGSYYPGGGLILHWDGTSWSRVKSPSGNELNAVSADSTSDGWAVGQRTVNGVLVTLTLRWNGTSWSRVKSPNPNPSTPPINVLNGVSAVSATDAWAVGNYTDKTTGSLLDALIIHWNGTSWSQVPSPIPPTTDLQLHGASAISASDAWAVGEFKIPTTALALHWNGTKWVKT